MSEGNSSFSEILPNLQLAWDSTSLGALKECSRKYYLSIVKGKASRHRSVHLTFGLHYHSSLEAYDHAKARGETHESALLTALHHAMCVTWERDLGRPWISDDGNKNRLTLIRSIVWYLDQFADDPLKTVILANGKPAVELSFRLQTELLAGTGEAFWLCGHLDRVATLDGDTYIVDRKTSKQAITPEFFDKFSPDNQMSTYSFAGQIVYQLPIKGIIIDGVQVAVTFSRFQRGIVPRSEGQLAEWYQGVAILLQQAESYARAGFWPMNEKSCLAGNTIVRVMRGKNQGVKWTIDKLYDIFHGINKGQRLDRSLDTYLLSDIGGRVGNQKVLNVIMTGEKECFRITTLQGKVIEATADHLFRTLVGWKRVDELTPGNKVCVWLGKVGKAQSERAKQESRIELQVVHHPYAHIHTVKGNQYRRVRKYRLVVEAAMNGMEFEDFLYVIRFDEKRAKTLVFLAPEFEVHHRNRNVKDDVAENLEVVTTLEHAKLHEDERVFAMNRLSTDSIISIESVGMKQTYDIQMEAPHHNFIANDFVAHNCGNYGGCEFREICGKDPRVREQWLGAAYVNRQWDPLKVRGDI